MELEFSFSLGIQLVHVLFLLFIKDHISNINKLGIGADEFVTSVVCRLVEHRLLAVLNVEL